MADPSQFDAEDPFAEGPDAQTLQAEEERQRQRKALEELVARRLRSSIDARQTSGIEQIWSEDDAQYNGQDDDVDIPDAAPVRAGKRTKPSETGAQRSRIVVNITKPKVDAYVSRVTELLIPNDDKPWEIEPTPVPELQQAVDGNDQRPITLADGQQRSAYDVAAATMQQAIERAKKASEQIDDWFTEGRVYKEWRRVVHDAARIGTGAIKGPVPMVRRDRKWLIQDGVSVIQESERVAPGSKAISVWDCFPDPSCGEDIHEGSWFIERDYLTARRLRSLAKVPDYDAEALADVIKEGPRTGRQRYDDRFQREKTGQTNTLDSETFETFYYYGDLPPDTLIAGGWRITGLLKGDGAPEEMAAQIEAAMALTTIPVVVTMVNERIVRISVNPSETGAFPYDFFRIEPVEGQPWGRSVGRKIRPAQKMIDGGTRAMLENAGMSAGPQIVIDRDRIEPANGKFEVRGRKLWFWRPGDEVKDVRFAFQAVNVPSAQAELQNIIKYALELADMLTNLPLMMQGDQGSAPDTVGGMAMLEANATSPLKLTAKAYDDDLVIPHLTRYYDWLMQDPAVPEECKGDMQIKARGSSALVLRDVYASVLPQLMPFIKDPEFGLDPKRYIEQLLRSNKLNPASLRLSPQEAEAKRKAMEENPPVDPKVQAAQINAQAKQAEKEADMADRAQEREFKAQQHAEQMALDRYTADIEFQIQAMEFAGQKEISFEQLKVMLATKAMDVRNKRELFAAERAFAESEGQGRGL